MHWFNTSDVACKQRYALKIVENISQLQDLVYYGFLTPARLLKIISYASKYLESTQQDPLSTTVILYKPFGTLDQAKQYAKSLADTSDWPFYFFGDDSSPERYWGLSNLGQIEHLEKKRRYARSESANIKYYRSLCYYGFITSAQAIALFEQFKALDKTIDQALIFPSHLDSQYTPVITFDQAHAYAAILAQTVDWPFYRSADSEDIAAYWGINRYGDLKQRYEADVGVGNFFGILFTASGLALSEQCLIFSMTALIYRNARAQVATWCWDHRWLFVLCTRNQAVTHKPLILDKQWVDDLLLGSAQLVKPSLSTRFIEKEIQRLYTVKSAFPITTIIHFLENIRMSNETILTKIEKAAKFFKQYERFSGETRYFLQEKSGLENYFDRSQLKAAEHALNYRP